jgi:hypothetical protein
MRGADGAGRYVGSAVTTAERTLSPTPLVAALFVGHLDRTSKIERSCGTVVLGSRSIRERESDRNGGTTR